MKNTPTYTNSDITSALEKYSDMVRRICFMYLKNRDDVDDIFQEVFLSLLKNNTKFETSEHEKAWLIRVTINKCKDFLKSFWHRNIDSFDETQELVFETKAENDLMHIILTLPKKYKDVIYLFYYEDFTVPEIANLLHEKENTIYSQLHRARNLIKEKLGGTENEYYY